MDSISPAVKPAHPLLHLGTSGWSYEDWVGNFYPPKTSSGRWLQYYISQFNTVEVDSTFYAIPPRSRVEKWAEAAPEGFEFALKVPFIDNIQTPGSTFVRHAESLII